MLRVVIHRLRKHLGCTLTIDLAGHTSSTAPIDAFTPDIKDLTRAVVDKCVIDGGLRQGGFGTIGLERTVSGLADAKQIASGFGK